MTYLGPRSTRGSNRDRAGATSHDFPHGVYSLLPQDTAVFLLPASVCPRNASPVFLLPDPQQLSFQLPNALSQHTPSPPKTTLPHLHNPSTQQRPSPSHPSITHSKQEPPFIIVEKILGVVRLGAYGAKKRRIRGRRVLPNANALIPPCKNQKEKTKMMHENGFFIHKQGRHFLHGGFRRLRLDGSSVYVNGYLPSPGAKARSDRQTGVDLL